MANKRIEMLNLKHLIRLKIEGKSNRKIAGYLGICRNTINQYVQFLDGLEQDYYALYALSEADLFALFPQKNNKATSKYAALSAQFSYYEKELKRTGSTYLHLWKEYREAHPDGYSYNQFKAHVKHWLKAQKVSMRIEHKYADKLFVDYTGKKLSIVDTATGKTQQVEVFIAILGASQYTYIEASESQQLDDFLASMTNSLVYFGGVPRAIVPDNLKSAVTKPSKYEPVINRNFQAFALHYQTTILPTRSYKPQDKALVENMVKIVYQEIFFPLRHQTFFCLKTLNQALHHHLTQVNTRPFKGRAESRKVLFDKEEKPLLQPLPTSRFYRKIFCRGKVKKDGHVWFGPDKHSYSVPYTYIGKYIQIQATHTTLEVYFDHQRIAIHPRSSTIGGFSTSKAHLAAHIRFVKDWSMEQFTTQAQAIGGATYAYFSKLFEHKTHPEQAYKSCMGILGLAKKYPKQRLNAACRRATFFDNYSYQTIKNILLKNLDQLPLPTNEGAAQRAPILTETDPNIRGAAYFD